MARRPYRQVTIGIRGAGIKGYDGWKRRASRLKGMPRNIVQVLRFTGDEIAIRARANAPVLTALLWSTIHARDTPAGSVVTAGAPNPDPDLSRAYRLQRKPTDLEPNTPAPYALRVHETHPTHSKFLERAYEEMLKPFREKYLRAAVKKSVRK